MIDTGEVKNQAALARKLGISRARVSQVLSILQLDKNLIEAVEQLGDTMPAQIIAERILRNYLLNPEMDKTKLFNKLFYDSRFVGND